MAVKSAEEDFDVVEAFSVLKRQKWFMIWFFVAFMILVLIVLAVWPRTYLSESVVQLGSVGTNPLTQNVFEPVAAKSIMESTEVLSSAVQEYNDVMDSDKTIRRFRESSLDVELIKEQVGRDEKLASYLKVSVKTGNPELSKDVNKLIIDNFLEYTTPFYNEKLQVSLQDKEQTEALIKQLNEDIKSAQKAISASAGSASDNLLLSRTVVDSRLQLVTSQTRLINIQADLASKREFKIISEPELPVKPVFPPVKLGIIAGIIVGVLLALALGFVRDSVKNG